MRLYLDSCLVIYLHEGPLELRRRVAELLVPPDGPAPQLCVSELVRMECRVVPLRQAAGDLLGAYDAFFELPGLELVPLGREVFAIATELRARHGLRTPDALHVAAAAVGGCDAFWTGDSRLGRHDVGIQVRVLDAG